MLTHILLSIVIVTVAGLAFALTSHKLGRGDKRIGCGAGNAVPAIPKTKAQPAPMNPMMTIRPFSMHCP